MKIYVEDTVGSKVWARCTVPNPPERYVGGLVVDGVVEGRPMKVTLPPEEMVQEEVVELRDVEDLCDLGHVHEATILEAIERRCAAGRPYVAAGDVVLAVNPFKWLPLYTEDLRALHSDAPSSDETRRAAHVYSVSGAAARGAARGEDQSILVSGESGAGKTETVKLMLAHLADIAQHGSATKTIVAQVLRAGPLLESFGNAATLRNGNSSRFAKFLRVEFDRDTMAIESSWCETALLEKTRVVERASGERTYHVFYAAFKRFKARLLVAQTHGRCYLARRAASRKRRVLRATVRFQAVWRGIDVRLVGYLASAKTASLALQTKLLRPKLARNRVAFVLEMKSKGERLDSLQSKLKNLGSPSQEEKKAPLPPPPRPKGSAVARGIFSSNKQKDAAADLDREKQKEILEKARAEAAATVAAAREVATEASRALEELRSENAALRERCAGAEARAESWRAQATKAKQREAQLLAIVDEAKRECVLAREQTSRHLDESSALHGTDAHQSYGRLRQKLLQHSAHMAPALRKKLLEKRKPQQKVTVTQAELRGFVEALVAEGVHVLKHSTNGKAQKRKLKLTDGGAALYWEKPGGGGARSKGESYPLSECVEVRGAHDLDPAAQGKLLCGTKTLRKSRSPKSRRGLRGATHRRLAPQPSPAGDGGVDTKASRDR